jgi:hypothetical protein
MLGKNRAEAPVSESTAVVLPREQLLQQIIVSMPRSDVVWLAEALADTVSTSLTHYHRA